LKDNADLRLVHDEVQKTEGGSIMIEGIISKVLRFDLDEVL
jgi:hypothetical protein